MEEKNKLNINLHFRREAKIMMAFMVLPIVIGLVIILLLPFSPNTSDVETCLKKGIKLESCLNDNEAIDNPEAQNFP